MPNRYLVLASVLGSFGSLACTGQRLHVGDDGLGGEPADLGGPGGAAGGQPGLGGTQGGASGGQLGATGGQLGAAAGASGSIVASGTGGPVEAPDAQADRPADGSPAPDGGRLDARLDGPSDGAPDAAADCGALYDIHNCGSCGHDCTMLPHISSNIGPEWLACEANVCHAYQCATGYAHCTSTGPDIGCETSLWSDVTNCGGCGVTCGQLPGSPGICHNGACVGECPEGFGDCTDDFGCETKLDTPSDCGACGHPACELANVVAPCRQPASSCDEGICAPGYANCDHSSPDCETALGAAGSCLPSYEGTVWLPTGQDGAVAVGADGVRFIGGQFIDPLDFDFTSGVDRRSPSGAPAPYHSPPSAYVTMAKADGSYGWTRTFTSSGQAGYATPQAGVVALAATADGGVVVGGNFQGSIVLDPAGTDGQSTPTQSAFIVKLDRNGTFVRGRILETTPTTAYIILRSLAVGADGSIYLGGMFWGEVDFDPGPSTVMRVGNGYPGGSPFLLKLNRDQSFGWVDTWDIPSTCTMSPGRLAVAPGGAVWVGGAYGGTCDFNPGTGVDRRQIGDGTGGQGYLLGVDAAGGYITTAVFGRWISDLTVDGQGAVYAVGTYIDTVDFDPGPAQVRRTAAPQPSSFTVKLNASGSFQWVSTQTDFTASAIALGPDGSILIAGMLSGRATEAGIVALLADQTRSWTLGFGGPDMAVNNLAATANGVFVAGWVYWDTDLDPTAGTDTVPAGNIGGNPFVSAYGF